MGKILTAIFGAGIVGSLYSLRTYLGIALILMVSTCSFKADIVDYVKESRKEAHQERMVQLNVEAEKLKIELEAKQLREAKEKAEVEFYQKETKRLEQEQEKKEKEKKLAQEKKLKAESEYEEKLRIDKALMENKRIEEQALWNSAKTKMCSDYQRSYVNLLKCAVNSTNPQLCAQGHDSATWFKSAEGERIRASQNNCNTSLTNWQ